VIVQTKVSHTLHMPKVAKQRSSAQKRRADGKPIPLNAEGKSTKKGQSVADVLVKDPDNQQKQTTPRSMTETMLGGDTSALSRGQRKRLFKREQYLKRERMVMSSLKLKKQDEQAKRIDGLDALKEALLETVSKIPEKDKEKTPPAQIVRSNRAKQSIGKKEIEHMKLVLEHPAFIANPLAAIHEHLKNTIKQATSEDQSKPVAVKAKPKTKKKSRFRATRMKNR
jgi:Ribosome biogenesis protein SLX9